MSVPDKVAETAQEMVVDAAEEVADKAEQFAEYARRLNKAKTKFYILGMAVGGLTGAVIAYKIAYSKAETKYSKIADDEIAEMRKHYQAKIVAAEATAQKLSPVKKIVAERGYKVPTEEAPPMAVPPPRVVPEDTGDEPEEPEVRNIFKQAEVTHEWDWHAERRKRSPDIPYVIHYDERFEIEGYAEVTLTYYDGDDVLCNERDEIIDPDNRVNLLGEGWMDRFGHGSNDPSIVYIRNDPLEIMYEVVKSPNYYAEEVHGFKHEEFYRGNLERMRARERDENDD